jgi:Beta2-adaptin appendage, C-terminal sub-domain
MPAQPWLKMWTQEIPPTNEAVLTVTKHGLSKQTLLNNNIVFVAERVIDTVTFMYGQAKLEDGSLFLLELQVNGSQIKITTRTFCMHLVGLFQDSIAELIAQQ